MATPENLLIIVNTGTENPYNQYASYVVAFLSKKLANVKNVTLYYGPNGVGDDIEGGAGYDIDSQLILFEAGKLFQIIRQVGS